MCCVLLHNIVMSLVGVAVAHLVGVLLVVVLPLEALLARCGVGSWMVRMVRPAVVLCLTYSAGAVYATNRRYRDSAHASPHV